MDEYFELCGQVFEWNAAKAKKNPALHGGVTFMKGAEVFMDSIGLQFDDDEHSGDEIRDCFIGRVYDGQLLRVSYTERPPNIRIISARPANAFDETRYANNAIGY